MNNLKLGDIVRCEDVSGFWDFITKGKLYEVIEVYTIGENNPKSVRKRAGIRIICDNGHKRGFNERRFVLDLISTRNKGIDGILN